MEKTLNSNAKTIIAAATLCLLSSCESETLTRCLPTNQTGTVVRTVDRGRDAREYERAAVAVRRQDKTVTTCGGMPDNLALREGDVIDGRTLHAYRTK